MALRWEQARLVGHTDVGRARGGLAARRRSRVGVAAAAAMLVAMIGSHQSQSVGSPVDTEFATEVGKIRRVTLADGSVITLDTRSRVSVAFAVGERHLRLLAGRARFEVAHDVQRPFVVSAGEGDVVATGTVFDVSLVDDHPRVRLIQGAVEVRRRSRGASVASVLVARLRPGQAIALGVAEVAPVQVAGDERWVSGMLRFDGVPLGDALADANRYSLVSIRLADPQLGALRVSGGFKAGDQQALARALAASFGLEADRDAAGNYVLHKVAR
jgi:transmembrane sensor